MGYYSKSPLVWEAVAGGTLCTQTHTGVYLNEAMKCMLSGSREGAYRGAPPTAVHPPLTAVGLPCTPPSPLPQTRCVNIVSLLARHCPYLRCSPPLVPPQTPCAMKPGVEAA